MASVDDLARAVAKAQAAYERCPEGHANEARLYTAFLEARVRLLQAQLADRDRGEAGARAAARDLARKLANAITEHAAAQERLLSAAKPKPRRRPSIAAGAPLFEPPEGEP